MHAERRPHARAACSGGGGLVAGHAHLVGVDPPHVDPTLGGGARHAAPRRPGTRAATVSKKRRARRPRRRPQPGRQHRGQARATRSRSPQPLRAVVDGVHRRPSRRAAPARCRCCSSPSPGGCAARASAAPAGSAGSPSASATPRPAGRAAPLQAGAHRHEPGVRPAEAHRHAETLRGADGDVRADLAGRAQQGQSASRSAATVTRAPAACAASTSARVVAHHPGRPRVLQRAARSTPGRQPSAPRSATTHVEAERLGPAGDHRDRLRQRVGVHHVHRSRALRRAAGERHRLGGGGGLVQQEAFGRSAGRSGR